MGILLKDVVIGLDVSLPSAYLKIDSFQEVEGQRVTNYVFGLHRSKCGQKVLEFELQLPTERGCPLKLGYTAIKQEGKLQQLLQLSYSTQSDD